MACNNFNLTYKLADSCETPVGGVQEIYLQTFDSSITYGLTASGTLINTISGTASYYLIETDSEIALTNGEITKGANKSVSINYTLTFNLSEISENASKITNEILRGRFRAVVRSNSGKYLLLGFAMPGSVENGTHGLGQTMDDTAFGTQLTLTFKELGKVAKFVDPSVIEPLIVRA